MGIIDVGEEHPTSAGYGTLTRAKRLQYLHENPVKAGFVTLPQEWKYSSAIDYYTECDGLLKLTEQRK